MSEIWGSLRQKSRRGLKIGWLITAGLAAVYIGGVQSQQDFYGISEEKATGLAAIEQRHNHHWPQRLLLAGHQPRTADGVVVGMPGGVQQAGLMAYVSLAQDSTGDATGDRKLVRTSSLSLLVENPADAVDKIRRLAEAMGGFLVNSQVNGAGDTTSASVAIHVPTGRLEEARTEIRKLGSRVDSDRIEARDVSKDYVDRVARLRNLHWRFSNVLPQ